MASFDQLQAVCIENNHSSTSSEFAISQSFFINTFTPYKAFANEDKTICKHGSKQAGDTKA